MKLNSIYIAAFQKDSQEIIVSIGLMSFLKSKYEKVTLFKPIIESNEVCEENTIYCFTKDEVEQFLANKKSHELLDIILDKYTLLSNEYDFVLIEGFDKYKSELAFDLNFQIAKNTNSGFVAVLNGLNKTEKHIQNEINIITLSINSSGCHYLGLIVNNTIKKFDNTLASIPIISELIVPTMYDMYTQLDCEKIYGSEKNLNRQIKDIKIAAMKLEHFLANIKDDDLVVVPSDRTDIILACFMALQSKDLPHISGILLTGDLPLDDIVINMLKSLDNANLVILKLTSDTYSSITKIQAVKPLITSKSYSKIAQVLGKFNRHMDFTIIEDKLKKNNTDIVTPIMFEHMLFKKAIDHKQHIVLPEASDDRILRATDILLHRKVVNITLLGDENNIKHRAKSLGLNIQKANIIDPLNSNLTKELSNEFYKLRKHKGILEDIAYEIISKDNNYFATMMVKQNIADGMVSGSMSTTANTVRPALEIIKTKASIDIVSSSFFMCMDTKVFVFADCAINQSPSAKDLAQIAISSTQTAQEFGIVPKVAILSYATGDSANSDEVNKVKEAVEIVRKLDRKVEVDGPIQYDAAVDKTIGKKKLPNSKIAGESNVLIFPDLNTGNNIYKAVQKSSKAVAVGPVLQGLNAAINDLSRGATVTDIINTVAITSIQAQGLKK